MEAKGQKMTVCEILDMYQEERTDQYEAVLKMARAAFNGYDINTAPVAATTREAKAKHPDVSYTIIALAVGDAYAELRG